MTTVSELALALEATSSYLSDGDRQVISGYAGDLLSFVMSRATKDSAWFTIMTNVNVCAVATLTEVSVVVVCEGCKPDETMLSAAKTRGVNVICTDFDVFHAVKKVTDANLL